MNFREVLSNYYSLVWIQDIPRLLPISLSTLYTWRTRGKYPEIFFKPGQKLLVDVNALLKIMDTEVQARADSSKNPLSKDHMPQAINPVRHMKQSELEQTYLTRISFEDPSVIYHEMRDFRSWNKEVFVSFCLDAKQRIFSREIVSIGLLNISLVHPREIFRKAIIKNCVAVVVAHNHPSGSCEPSKEDVHITECLVRAGHILCIHLLDHIVCAKHGYFSFAEHKNI